jgi:hypothetical protein
MLAGVVSSLAGPGPAVVADPISVTTPTGPASGVYAQVAALLHDARCSAPDEVGWPI